MSDEMTSPDLPTALAKYEIDVSVAQQESLQRYTDALWDWNRRINLTRHTDYDRFVARDVIDARMLAEHLGPGEKVLDVGSGGGAPGIILAALRPDLQISLCESVGKKAAALKEIAQATKLAVAVHHGRAESLLEDFCFDTLTVRAVAPIPKLLRWFEPHWSAFTRLLLVKGPRWIEERGTARHEGLMRALALRKLTTYMSPDHGAESVVLEIRRKPPK
jgi:16S rRNA (guanine527-N7)-methyltransferase